MAGKVLESLSGQVFSLPPIWMMRQAGRYLPEYRATREKAGSFLKLCFNPELAAEVTLQPIRRFSFDAAILFSDILVIPHALGQEVTFEAGEGPRLQPLAEFGGVSRLADQLDPKVTGPIYEAIRLIKAQLPSDVTFLGFCGAPWTVATYMVAGQGGDEQIPARRMAAVDPQGFQALIDRLVEVSIDYLVGQFEAGVEAVQIFDTWAGILDPYSFERWCIAPLAAISKGVRERVPHARIIGYPKGGDKHLGKILQTAQLDGFGLDWTIDPQAVIAASAGRVALQGCLDPITLITGGDELDRQVDRILHAFQGQRFIFNLGHGIRPETPIAHVEQMIRRVRDFRG